MAGQAIRNEGRPAERKLLKLVPRAVKSPTQAAGDALIELAGQKYFIEVKKCAKGDTINQVRAIKFATLVVYSPQLPLPWAVVAPQNVVRLVLDKERGQHTEIALESANVSLKSLQGYRCSGEQLAGRVARAARSGAPYVALQRRLAELKSELRTLQASSAKAVRRALAARR